MTTTINADNGVVSGSAGLKSTPDSSGILALQTNGVTAVTVDASQNVLVTAPSGLGYGTGAGGTVTQLTSKSTAVTLNKPTGQITTAADALAANTETFFQLLNSSINVGDVVVVNNNNSTNYATRVGLSASGAITVLLKNISAASLSQAVTINFAVIKGATS